MALLLLTLDPRHQQPHDSLLLVLGQISALRDLVPFFRATAAAAGTGVHRFENRITVHRCLLPSQVSDIRKETNIIFR